MSEQQAHVEGVIVYGRHDNDGRKRRRIAEYITRNGVTFLGGTLCKDGESSREMH